MTQRLDHLIDLAIVWLKWTAIALLLVIFFTTTHAFYAAKFGRTTGDAEWLWTWNWVSRQKPAVFFATHDFVLEGNGPWVRINIACDPMYTLFFNEVEVGGGRWEDAGSIDVYDVTDLAIAGVNRIVVAVRAPDGVGGLLASVDTGPLSRNVVVTGGHWRLSHRWSPDLLLADPPDAVEPRVLGAPPDGRWDFPPKKDRDRYEAGGFVLHPTSTSATTVTLSRIALVGGVAIAGRDDVEATVYDFGRYVTGRPRLALPPGEMRALRFRTVSDLAHLRDEGTPEALVIAPGEKTVTEPRPRTFRYFVALDPVDDVEVLSEKP